MTSTTLSPSTEPTLLLLDPRKARLQRASKTVFTIARIIQDDLTHSGVRFRAAMCTLTYQPGVAWEPKHISALTNSMSKYAKRNRFPLFSYVWVLELMKSGAPHYHLLLWLPRGLTLPKPDKQGWWPHGSTRIEWAYRPVGYMAKYASKMATKTVSLPPNARICGYGGLTASQKHELSWFRAPAWLRQLVPQGHHIKRQAEGWWLDATSNIRYLTPYLSEWDSVNGVVKLEYVGWTLDSIEFI